MEHFFDFGYFFYIVSVLCVYVFAYTLRNLTFGQNNNIAL